MTYVERRVAPGVDLWRSAGRAGAHRILPDGCMDMLFDGEQLLVAGPASTATMHHDERDSSYIAVRLHAGRGPAALGLPATELLDQTVSLTNVWSAADARNLTERVADAPATELTRWALSVDPDPFGARLLDLLSSGGSVAGAAAVLGYSPRQVQRLSRAHFGYGPRQLARILRLGQAVATADAGASWTEVATATGYADQAHLTRDVRALTGVTPQQLRSERVRSVQAAA